MYYGCYKLDLPQDGTIIYTFDASNLFPETEKSFKKYFEASFLHLYTYYAFL